MNTTAFESLPNLPNKRLVFVCVASVLCAACAAVGVFLFSGDKARSQSAEQSIQSPFALEDMCFDRAVGAYMTMAQADTSRVSKDSIDSIAGAMVRESLSLYESSADTGSIVPAQDARARAVMVGALATQACVLRGVSITLDDVVEIGSLARRLRESTKKAGE